MTTAPAPSRADTGTIHLDDRMLAGGLADVRWAYLDASGAARQHTSYRYLLRRSDSGELAIQVVVDTTPACRRRSVAGGGLGDRLRRAPWAEQAPLDQGDAEDQRVDPDEPHQ